MGATSEQRHAVDIRLTLTDDRLWEKTRRLAQIIGNWKRSKIVISGTLCSSFLELERGVAEVKRCYANQKISGMEEMFCSGRDAPDDEPDCFGCRLVKGVSLAQNDYYHSSLNWYQFGDLLEDQSLFVIDKEEIFRICKLKTENSLSVKCPAFDWDRVKRDVGDLPCVIEVGDSSPFVIKYSKIDPSEAIGIKPREKKYDNHYSMAFGYDDEEHELLKRNIPSVRYSDVAAQDIVLAEIKNIVHLPLTHPEYFTEIGVEPQRGIILYGPPGNGKTLIVKAVATESNAHLEIINGPEILSKWVGKSEENLRRVFKRAKKLEPSVILIDEIDALAPNRDEVSRNYEITLVSQLLVLLDGLESRGRLVVIATTNRIEAVDPAIRRPGRFDYHIKVDVPDEKGREAILKAYIDKLKTTFLIDIQSIAKDTEGYSGAELAAVCREAGLLSIKRGIEANISPEKLLIDQNDFLNALEEIRAKRIEPSLVLKYQIPGG